MIRWLPTALAERDEQIDYIAMDNLAAAIDQDELIERQVDQLLKQPRLGRPGRVKGTRELVVGKTPFIVVYRILGNNIEILNLLHGAQRWPRAD